MIFLVICSVLMRITKWNLKSFQSNASLSVSENVQSIIAAAAPQFTSDQLDVLFSLIHKSWLQEDERARQQLVSFIGKIGHNSKLSKEIEKVRKCIALHVRFCMVGWSTETSGVANHPSRHPSKRDASKCSWRCFA